jgi:anti-sigma factor RsiW
MTYTVPITDEELVAYLDGAVDRARRRDIEAALEHDEVLVARLAKLDIDTDAIRAVFGRIEEKAPVGRLRARLDDELARARSRPRVRPQWFRMTAALLLGVGLGLGAGFGLGVGPHVSNLVDSTMNWRVAVADYHVLYTTATLASVGGDGVNQRGEVAAVARKLRLPIAVDALQLPGFNFKRAQILQFKGEPLAQFAYLDQSGTPFAFCATHTGEADSAIETSTIHGLAAASWNKDGYGFIVIGGTQADIVRRAATELAARI